MAQIIIDEDGFPIGTVVTPEQRKAAREQSVCAHTETVHVGETSDGAVEARKCTSCGFVSNVYHATHPSSIVTNVRALQAQS